MWYRRSARMAPRVGTRGTARRIRGGGAQRAGAASRKGAGAHVRGEKILLMLAKGGVSQSEVAATLHVSKRDVSACARVLCERSLTFDDVSAMGAAGSRRYWRRRRALPPESPYLQSDMDSLIERKGRDRRLTVKMFWTEHCEAAAAARRPAYAYQTFCEMFLRAAEKAGATRRLAHEPGAKAYVDWAGDTASLADRLTGAKTRVYVIVVALPYSDRFWAQGSTDMRQRFWQEDQARVLEDFGGVPRMLVPDNASTATDRSSACATLVNEEYARFAGHYEAAVVPARVRRPRDKAVAESTVDLVEKWIAGPPTRRHSTRWGSPTGSAWRGCGGRAPAHAVAARGALRDVRVAQLQGRPGPPRHRRLHALLRPLPPDRDAGRHQALRLAGHSHVRRRGRRRARQAPGPQGAVLDARRAHAALARSHGLALVAGAVLVVGAPDRRGVRGGGGRAARQPAGRGAGPRASREHTGPLQGVHARAPRAGPREVERARRGTGPRRTQERDFGDQGDRRGEAGVRRPGVRR